MRPSRAAASELRDNDAKEASYRPSPAELSAIERLQRSGVTGVDLLDRMVEQGEDWLVLTMRRLDHFEKTGLAPKDYSTWCEHALGGAYDWIDHERLGASGATATSSPSWRGQRGLRRAALAFPTGWPPEPAPAARRTTAPRPQFPLSAASAGQRTAPRPLALATMAASRSRASHNRVSHNKVRPTTMARVATSSVSSPTNPAHPGPLRRADQYATAYRFRASVHPK